MLLFASGPIVSGHQASAVVIVQEHYGGYFPHYHYGYYGHYRPHYGYYGQYGYYHGHGHGHIHAGKTVMTTPKVAILAIAPGIRIFLPHAPVRRIKS